MAHPHTRASRTLDGDRVEIRTPLAGRGARRIGVQTVAARTVAAALPALAKGEPAGKAPDLAGPVNQISSTSPARP